MVFAKDSRFARMHLHRAAKFILAQVVHGAVTIIVEIVIVIVVVLILLAAIIKEILRHQAAAIVPKAVVVDLLRSALPVFRVEVAVLVVPREVDTPVVAADIAVAGNIGAYCN